LVICLVNSSNGRGRVDWVDRVGWVDRVERVDRAGWVDRVRVEKGG
jgi:hypothetical protein